jgi:hypothetical protein
VVYASKYKKRDTFKNEIIFLNITKDAEQTNIGLDQLAVS